MATRTDFYLKYKKTAIKALDKKLGKEATVAILQEVCKDPEFNKNISICAEQTSIIEKQTELIGQMEQCKIADVKTIKKLNDDIDSLNRELVLAKNELSDYRKLDQENKNLISNLLKDIERLETKADDFKNCDTHSLHQIRELEFDLDRIKEVDRRKSLEIQELREAVFNLNREIQLGKITERSIHRPSIDLNTSHLSDRQTQDINTSPKAPLTVEQSLQKQAMDQAAKDVISFEGLLNEYNYTPAAENFLKFHEAVMKFKRKYEADDKYMLSFIDAKLRGEVKLAFDVRKPQSFNEAIEWLKTKYIKNNYATSIRNTFRSMSRNVSEPVESFHNRVVQAIENIKSLTYEPPHFDEIEAVLLKPYTDEMVNYHGVKMASLNKDYTALIEELEANYIRKPSLLKPVKNNRIMTANDSTNQEGNYNRGKRGNKHNFSPANVQSNPQQVDISVPPPNYQDSQPFRG